MLNGRGRALDQIPRIHSPLPVIDQSRLDEILASEGAQNPSLVSEPTLLSHGAMVTNYDCKSS